MGNVIVKSTDALVKKGPQTKTGMAAMAAGAIISAVVLAKKKTQISKALTDDLPLYILTNHRSAVVTIFGLPMSMMWNIALGVRSKYIHTFHSAPHLHDARVATIQEQVLNRPDKNAPLCTARPGWMSVSLSYRNYKSKWNAIEMPLYDILDVDTDAMIVRVEPFVSIGQLTHELNPKGYTLPVVPEMDDLTIGGLINGTGIESSSHKYGLFHEIITELELLLGDGTVVTATADNEYSDLFHAIPWSYGTLALLLSAKLKLIPCKNYVKLTYTPHHTREGYVEHMRQLSGEYNLTAESEEEKKEDGVVATTDVPMFVEGLAYTLDSAVIMAGEFIDAKDVPRGSANRISLWWKPWFYKHVEKILNSKEEKVEYIPLTDYYHRHTQSLFWEMELMIPIGNHPVFRWLLGWLMPPKVSFLKISQTEMTRKLTEETHVAQDFLVPTRKMSEFLEICDDEYDKIYPLWLCLHDHSKMPGSLLKDPACPNPVDGHEMYIDIGVYGLPRCVHEKREDEFEMKKSMRKVLKELVDMDGFQMLYADVFSTREEFEEMFDHTGYRKLRKKYKADGGAFKEVYDKMHLLL